MLFEAQLQGASLDHAELQGASLDYARVWRVHGSPKLDLTYLESLDCKKTPWEEEKSRGISPQSPARTYQDWREIILSRIPDDFWKHLAAVRLSPLDPDKKLSSFDPEQKFWNETQCPRQQGPDAKQYAEYLVALACSAEAAPHVARGLIWISGRIDRKIETVDRLRKGKADAKVCPGVKGFTEEDWAQLDQLVERVQKSAAKTSAPNRGGATYDGP